MLKNIWYNNNGRPLVRTLLKVIFLFQSPADQGELYLFIHNTLHTQINKI